MNPTARPRKLANLHRPGSIQRAELLRGTGCSRHESSGARMLKNGDNARRRKSLSLEMSLKIEQGSENQWS
jgi:hypothetical protein